MSENINREFLHGQVSEFVDIWIKKKVGVSRYSGRPLLEEILKDFIDEQMCVQVTAPTIDEILEAGKNWEPPEEPLYLMKFSARIRRRKRVLQQQIGTPTSYKSNVNQFAPDHVYPTNIVFK